MLQPHLEAPVTVLFEKKLTSSDINPTVRMGRRPAFELFERLGFSPSPNAMIGVTFDSRYGPVGPPLQGRIIIPKRSAEAHFPPLAEQQRKVLQAFTQDLTWRLANWATAPAPRCHAWRYRASLTQDIARHA